MGCGPFAAGVSATRCGRGSPAPPPALGVGPPLATTSPSGVTLSHDPSGCVSVAVSPSGDIVLDEPSLDTLSPALFTSLPEPSALNWLYEPSGWVTVMLPSESV
jgi:hypothetical protein